MATKELAIGAVTEDQIELIKRTVARGASNDELKLFFYDCARRNVHPLDKLIHFTKRNGTYTPITSIDFMRSQASDSGEYAGNEDAIHLQDEKGDLFQSTVTVWRITQGQRCPYTASARWEEYCPSDPRGRFMWDKMPFTMLGKCAEALALRKAFPKQLAGLYAKEEMQQAGPEEARETKLDKLAEPVQPPAEDQSAENAWREKIKVCSTAEEFNLAVEVGKTLPPEFKIKAFKILLERSKVVGLVYDTDKKEFYDPSVRFDEQLHASLDDLPPSQESLPVELEPISKQEENQISAARRKAKIPIEEWANIKGKYGVEHTRDLQRGDFAAVLQDIKDHEYVTIHIKPQEKQ